MLSLDGEGLDPAAVWRGSEMISVRIGVSNDGSAINLWRRDVELKETVEMIYCHLRESKTIFGWSTY